MPKVAVGSTVMRRARLRRNVPACVAALAVFTALLTFSGTPAARAAGSKPLKISGIVTEISPQQITIQGDKGEMVTLATRRDYTGEVAFGAGVTATYGTENGLSILESLTPPLQNFFAPPYEIRAHIRKVIILQNSDVAGADDFFEAMQHYVESQIGWYVKPRILAEEIQKHAAPSESTLDLIDPQTGAFDMSHYATSHRDLIRRIADETRVDAVLEANLVPSQALLDARRRVATWDGYEQSTSGGGGRGLGHVEFMPIKAMIPATTLELKLWDAEGNLLWTRRRGFAVLYVQTGLVGKLRVQPLDQTLQDTVSVNQWFHTFFEPLLAPGRSAPPVQRRQERRRSSRQARRGGRSSGLRRISLPTGVPG